MAARIKTFIRKTSMTLALSLLFCGVSAAANVPYPRVKPQAPNISQVLSKSDAIIFKKGIAAAERRYWRDVDGYIKKISDPAAKDTLRWLKAWRDRNTDFDDLTYVTQNLGNWPRMTGIRAKAERKLWDKSWPAQRVISWFQGVDPVSGEGRLALARANFELGRQEDGQRWLQYAWREARLSRDLQRTIYKKYKTKLTPADHAARADFLIWLGSAHFSKVDGLLSLMPRGERALAVARMRVARNGSGMDAAIKAVPADLKDHPGLIFERARWRRRKKTKDYALPVYFQTQIAPATDEGKKRLWTERKIMAYWAIKEGKFKDAYRLSLNHGMTGGVGFADAEFLAGWLALVKLNEPAKAIRHFETLRGGVNYPVSKSRASYWLGRAHKAARLPDANLHFAHAAEHIQTFYGQLAASELGNGNYIFLPPETDGFVYKAEFEQDARVKALRLLGETRSEYYFNTMAFHLDDEVETAAKLTLLSQLSRDYGYMKPSVRAAKQASRFGTFLPESGYPKPEVFLALESKFDKAFSMALSRQESEFNPAAVSSAKAYGLMQMIHGTARETARRHRVPYSRNRLTSDPEYSAKLGSLHVNDLLKRYDGSYIMTAAAYNAGPHRVSQWVKSYGDPRTGDIDPIDWIESVPFSETRNYIHRVLENLNIYRARLNNGQAENRLPRDISQGAFAP
jgi:soluble lytic murein transglycosylase